VAGAWSERLTNAGKNQSFMFELDVSDCYGVTVRSKIREAPISGNPGRPVGHLAAVTGPVI
jgi:hypothetical protein